MMTDDTFQLRRSVVAGRCLDSLRRPAVPAATPARPAPAARPRPARSRERHHPRAPGRLALAAAQGSIDEVVLPVTEVHARRARSERGGTRAPRLCLHAPVEVRRLRGRDEPRWTG